MTKSGPNPGLGLAILRVVVGVVYITHGIPKLLGGVPGTAEALGHLGIPLPGLFAWVVTLLETFGGLSLVAGFLVGPVAFLFMIEMIVGILLVHAPNGWYVVGGGSAGAEYNTVLIAALLALMLAGPGAAAVDGRSTGGPVSAPGQSEA
ncbi:MAG TPA: DoxX family protein [Gemmatimonadota bacterium]|nr:DoxX family protein [Gemmatimonadota bacterium]